LNKAKYKIPNWNVDSFFYNQVPHKQNGINCAGLHVNSSQILASFPVEPVELTEAEEHGLGEILGQLLDGGEVTEAEQVMLVFGRSFVPVRIIVVCYLFAACES